MCGIYGILAPPGASAERGVLDRMGRTLVHRGPDGDGVLLRGRAGLGCRRLAIIDVEHGAQPLTNERGDVTVVCNGEIYNHRTLRDRLVSAGHRFRTRSDVEVIPHLYEERGMDFLDELDGMFALALWDERAGRLVLARDRMGEKPLYYASTASGLIFASEPKAILATGVVDRAADIDAIAGFLRTGYVSAPSSAFGAISAVVPGTRVVAEGLRRASYWDIGPFLEGSPAALDLESAAVALRRELERSVRAALVSDVPVGVFLSGGLDSTSVAAIARAELGGEVDSFTIAFDVESFDERDHALLAARELGTRPHVLTITPELFLEGLRALAPLMDEPIADQSFVPTYLLARYARTRVKVVLVGEGSDELFAGYPTYPGGVLASWYRRLPAPLRAMLRSAAPHVGTPHGNVTLRYMVRRFLELAEAPPAVRHRAWMGTMSADAVAALATPGGALAELPTRDAVETPHARSALDALLRLDLTGYLRDELLTQLDRATMAASLEGRAPFLDHHLVEFACSLPPGLKLRGPIGKRVLRRAVADVVPAHTRRRIKRGLAVPLAAWLAGPLLPFVRDTLERLDPRVFRREAVQALLDEHVERRRDNRRELWALIVLQLWSDACAVTGDLAASSAPAPRADAPTRVAVGSVYG